jgi:hypothetical protein
MSHQPDVGLSRRSVIAAAAVLFSVGPLAASRALANNHQTNIPGCGPSNNTPPKCLCFLRGTRIQTPEGETAIEHLKIGDVVTTQSGDVRAIRWIGRLEFLRMDGWDEGSLPTRIAKDALGPGMPRRELYVSRAHMLYLNGVLIPASDLINGRTVSIVTPDEDSLQYFHIEFGSHDVVLAEGTPCESLRATPDHIQAFDNYAEYEALTNLLPPADTTPYAPIAAHYGGRGELKSRLRSALAPIVDLRTPGDVVRDSVEAHALSLSNAA